MGICEMCGSENGLYKAEVEGTILNVCKHCAKFGKVIENVPDKRFVEKFQRKQEKERKDRPLISKDEIIEVIVDDFARIIKEKRESMGLKQEDFAKKINEKLSLIHKIETGNFEPNIRLARKIERFLKVKLVGQQSGGYAPVKKTKSEAFTLGDFIKIK